MLSLICFIIVLFVQCKNKKKTRKFSRKCDLVILVNDENGSTKINAFIYEYNAFKNWNETSVRLFRMFKRILLVISDLIDWFVRTTRRLNTNENNEILIWILLVSWFYILFSRFQRDSKRFYGIIMNGLRVPCEFFFFVLSAEIAKSKVL